MADALRLWQARALFREWTGVTHPDLLAARWHNLNREDRQVWLQRADEELDNSRDAAQ